MWPYVIAATKYNPTSGGGRTLWNLADTLAKAGQGSFVPDSAGEVPPGMSVKRVNDAKLARMMRTGAIAVYPDVMPGNVWHSKHPVHWALVYPGAVKNEIGTCWTPGTVEGEKVYVFHKMLLKYFPRGMEDLPELFMVSVERDLFNCDELPAKRGGFWYKNKWRDGTPPWVSTLPHMPLPMKRPDFATYFKRHVYGVFLDYLTFAMHEAGLCGTWAVLPRNSVFDREDYERSPLHHGLPGVAWDAQPAEIERARAEVKPRSDGSNAVSDRYEEVQAVTRVEVEAFIVDTQGGW